METQPTTLQEAIVYFADPDNCLNYAKARRWPDGVVVCPTCKGIKVTFLANQHKWQCGSHHPKRAVLPQGRDYLRGLPPIGL